MGYPTGIEWTDMTWNCIGGCSIKSPGCIHCYAQDLAGTRLVNHPLYKGTTDLVKGKPVFNGTMTVLPDDHPRWTEPLKWRGAKNPVMGAGMPSLIFVGDMSDLFHEDRPVDQIDRVFAFMALCPRHIFQVLTKRPDRMREYLCSRDTVVRIYDLVCDIAADGDVADVILIAPGVDEASALPGTRIFLDNWPLQNVWVGTSCEDDRRYRERWPILAETPAAVRFISYEPAIGPLVDLWAGTNQLPDWIICGGESGPERRQMDPMWARDLREMCKPHGAKHVAFFMKQMTGRAHIPPDLMVRQFPLTNPRRVTVSEPQMSLI